MEKEAKVKSLYKALQVLECFSVEQPELGITQISDALGLYKSNVHNILTTFEQCGYIEKNPETNKYRLGFKILELSYILNSNLGLHNIVNPIISALSSELNEIVYFAIPRDGKVFYLDGAYPNAAFPVRSMMGETADMFCTALGKVMLAFSPDEEQEALLQMQTVRSFTPNTITDMDMLRIELAAIRNQGYSIDNMEHEYGIKCVSVPIFNRDQSLFGAVSASGPSLRMSNETIGAYAKILQEYSQRITARLYPQ